MADLVRAASRSVRECPGEIPAIVTQLVTHPADRFVSKLAVGDLWLQGRCRRSGDVCWALDRPRGPIACGDGLCGALHRGAGYEPRRHGGGRLDASLSSLVNGRPGHLAHGVHDGLWGVRSMA